MYSVGQHSLLVSSLLEESGFEEHVQLQGLLHDASEAYLTDLNTPTKQHVPGYKMAEMRAQKSICKKFGLPYPFHHAVKQADNEAFDKEKPNLLPPYSKNSNYIPEMPPSTVRDMFRDRFLSLGGSLD